MSKVMNYVADTIKDGAEEAAEQSAATLGACLSQARETLRDVAGRTGRAVSAGYDRFSHRAQDLEAVMEEEIQEWPISSVLVAMGIGFALGFFLHGLTRSKPRRTRSRVRK